MNTAAQISDHDTTAMARTRKLIDRSLDVGNRRRFHELCGLLKAQQAQARRR